MEGFPGNAFNRPPHGENAARIQDLGRVRRGGFGYAARYPSAPAWARLIASTERSTADHSRAISVLQALSPSSSPALAPAARETRKPARWLIWPDHTGIASSSNWARDIATAGDSLSSRLTGAALITTA